APAGVAAGVRRVGAPGAASGSEAAAGKKFPRRQHNSSADERDHYAAPEADRPGHVKNGPEQETADDRARHSDHDVGDAAKPASRHDPGRDGSGNQTDDDPRQP